VLGQATWKEGDFVEREEAKKPSGGRRLLQRSGLT